MRWSVRWILGFLFVALLSFASLDAFGYWEPEILQVVVTTAGCEAERSAISFSASDEQIYCIARIKVNQASPRRSYDAILEWYAPDGSLYAREDFRLDRPRTTTTYSVCSRLAVKETRAACLSGSWRVSVTIPFGGDRKTVSFTLSAPPSRPPAAQFSWKYVEPRMIFFDATESSDPDGTIVSYSWDFGDAYKGEGPTVTHLYARDGKYQVILDITDNCGAVARTQKTIPIPTPNQPPVAKFTCTSVVAVREVVTFDATRSYDPDGSIESYVWDFGDGAGFTRYTATTTHTYQNAGTYTVRLTVKDNKGSTATITHSLSVIFSNQRPVAAFLWWPSTPSPGDEVSFDASGSYDPDGYIRTYYWDFDSNSIVDRTESQPTVRHIYAGCGSQKVTLRVVDDKGASGVKTETIQVNCPPTARFSCTPPVPQVQDEIQFDARSSSDPGGQIVSYSWEFGDGSPVESGAQVAHVYAEVKEYTVVLTVTDDKGLSGITRRKVRVNTPPVAAFDYSPAMPNPGVGVSFTMVEARSLSYDPDGVIVSYTLNFGDGTIKTIRPPQRQLTHSFSAGGSYTATLTVTDNDGASMTYSQQITVNQPPVPLFNFTPSTPNPGDEVSFDAFGSYDPDGSIVSYTWSFGDTTSGTGPQVTHRYSNQGHYNVRLVVRDNAGAVGTLSQAIEVKDTIPPTSMVTLPPLACGYDWYGAPVSIRITASDNGTVSAIRYKLDGGSSTVISGAAATVRINEGTHTLEYWATDTVGNVENPHNQVTVSIDLRGPYVNIRVPSQGAAFYLNQPITTDASISDVVSGVSNTTVPESVDTTTVGKHMLVAEATDLACHRSSVSHNYFVHYKVKVASPMQTELIWVNTPSQVGFKGQAIPVKFEIPVGSPLPLSLVILDFYDSPVTPAAFPSVQVMRVGTAATYNVISSVGGVLALNQDNMQYEMTLPTYNLTRGIYELWVATDDGGTHRIRFQVR